MNAEPAVGNIAEYQLYPPLLLSRCHQFTSKGTEWCFFYAFKNKNKPKTNKKTFIYFLYIRLKELHLLLFPEQDSLPLT